MDTGVVSDCGHLYCRDCISEHIKRSSRTAEDGAARCPICRHALGLPHLFDLRRLLPQPEVAPVADSVAGAAAADGEGPITSTKMRLALRAVQQMLAADQSHKVTVAGCPHLAPAPARPFTPSPPLCCLHAPCPSDVGARHSPHHDVHTAHRRPRCA